MSTVFDVESVSIIEDTTTTFLDGVDSVTITDATTWPSVTIDVPADMPAAIVEVPGVQGAPGLQNVYAQLADPSKDELGNTIWGAEETGFIWIEVNV